jgi:hypothetical protein
MKPQNHEIIDLVLNRIAENYPIEKNVVVTTNGHRFPLDAVLDNGNYVKIYSAWYVGGESAHILPLYNEHAALGVLACRGVEVEVECILILDTKDECESWKQWYNKFNCLNTFNKIQFTFVSLA